MKTYSVKPKDITHNWYLIDAKDKVLGRLASEISKILTGKNKPIYTPHMDTGDFVIVINASKVKLTGNKLENKVRYRHTGYVGNLKETPYKELMAEKPDFVIYEAVRGMLPKNRLSSQMLKKLKVYKGEEHPHKTQKPETLEMQS